MPTKQLVFALGLIFASLNAVPASAQSVQQGIVPCAERGEIIQELSTKFSEAPVSMGLTNNGAVLEMFVSKDRTFTVVVTHPTGISCLIASGGNWESLKADLVGLKI